MWQSGTSQHVLVKCDGERSIVIVENFPEFSLRDGCGFKYYKALIFSLKEETQKPSKARECARCHTRSTWQSEDPGSLILLVKPGGYEPEGEERNKAERSWLDEGAVRGQVEHCPPCSIRSQMKAP